MDDSIAVQRQCRKERGGLYLNVDAIASIRSAKSPDGQDYECHILMVDGTEYTVFNQLSDVLEDINRILMQRTGKEVW